MSREEIKQIKEKDLWSSLESFINKEKSDLRERKKDTLL